MMKWKKDVLYGVVIAAIAIGFAVYTTGMNDSLMQYVPAKAGSYTRFWLALLAVFCVILILRALKERDETKTNTCLYPAAVFTIVTLGAYVFALDYLGFLISTPIYLMGCMVYYTWKSRKFVAEDGSPLPKQKNVKSIVLMLIGSIVVTLVTYYVFTEMVGMLLPSFNLW